MDNNVMLASCHVGQHPRDRMFDEGQYPLPPSSKRRIKTAQQTKKKKKKKKRRTVLGDDGVGVGAAVAVDVIDGFLKTFDSFDGAVQTAVFCAQGFGSGRSECQVLVQRRPCEDVHLNQRRQRHEGYINIR